MFSGTLYHSGDEILEPAENWHYLEEGGDHSAMIQARQR